MAFPNYLPNYGGYQGGYQNGFYMTQPYQQVQQAAQLAQPQAQNGAQNGLNWVEGAEAAKAYPVPPNCTVVGIPGRIVKKDRVRIPRKDLDQVNLPDPILDAISELREENRRLKEELDIIKSKIHG